MLCRSATEQKLIVFFIVMYFCNFSDKQIFIALRIFRKSVYCNL